MVYCMIVYSSEDICEYSSENIRTDRCEQIVQTLIRSTLIGRTQGAPYRGYGYVPLRFGGNVVRRMGTQTNRSSLFTVPSASLKCGSGRDRQWCWVPFSARASKKSRTKVRRRPVVGADGCCLAFFFSHLSYIFSFPLISGRRLDTD